jgi:hypothetical protein
LADARDKQVHDALHVMEHQQYIRWPYQALHEMAGPIPMGSAVYIGARSGGGKTTFMYSTIEAWRRMGYGITVLPLEQRPRDWRMGWSAVRCGVRADDILSGDLTERARQGEDHAIQQLERVRRDVALQSVDPALQKVNVCVDVTVDVTGLEVACAVAHDRGDQIVVIDHIDHISGEGKRGGVMDQVIEVNDAVLRLAKNYNLALICTSQLSLNRMRASKNPLDKFAPPQTHDLAYPSKKIQIATQILGLYRPIKAGATRQEIKDASEGEGVERVISVNRMGVVAMKLRFRGRNEGHEVALAFDDGLIRDLTPAEVSGEDHANYLKSQFDQQARADLNAKREASRQEKLTAKYEQRIKKQIGMTEPAKPLQVEQLPDLPF